ncbi:MAG: hypothetical protein K0Q57_286 [Gammaproteobacteria bacterium]|nr:hypothetical protein [Gammaproteobacteria bacterium]
MSLTMLRPISEETEIMRDRFFSESARLVAGFKADLKANNIEAVKSTLLMGFTLLSDPLKLNFAYFDETQFTTKKGQYVTKVDQSTKNQIRDTFKACIRELYKAAQHTKKPELNKIAYSIRMSPKFELLGLDETGYTVARLNQLSKQHYHDVKKAKSKPQTVSVQPKSTQQAPSFSLLIGLKNAVVSVALYAAMGIGMVYDFFAKMFDSSKSHIEPKAINVAVKAENLPVARAITAESGLSPDCLEVSQFEGLHRDTVENFKRSFSGSEQSDISSVTARGSFSTVTSLYNAARQVRSVEANRDRAMTL